jgi:hypothetical protein
MHKKGNKFSAKQVRLWLDIGASHLKKMDLIGRKKPNSLG